MVKLEFNVLALKDLIGIKQYRKDNFAEDSYFRLKQELNTVFENLTLFPFSGSGVRSKRFRDYRYVIVESNYVFYTFRKSVLTIERILHTSRDYKKLLDIHFPV